MTRIARYPRHLARHVAARLSSGDGPCPSEGVLKSLFETLYFVSLRTDEGRPCRFTVNYLDPCTSDSAGLPHRTTDQWNCIRLKQTLPFDVRTLAKLADAVAPSVSSLAVFSDERGQLFVWGLVDQELRYADYATLDSLSVPKRPGLFQVTINGVGNLGVYDNYSLICSLEHSTLVKQYHDVIWSGPVHSLLKAQLAATYGRFAGTDCQGKCVDRVAEEGLSRRWLNAICRVLMHIQQYRHGGGLLIAPNASSPATNVKYEVHYDRLPRALVGLVQHDLGKGLLEREIGERCRDGQGKQIPSRLHEGWVAHRRQLEARKNEVLGCARFIASLSRVDGFVLLDRSLVVHGFGVELRADSSLSEIWIASDSSAHARWMRPAHLEEFGTRHRAMMRYCFEVPGTLGFVVSQDGDIRAIIRHGDRLVFWENVNVQLAFKVESQTKAAASAA